VFPVISSRYIGTQQGAATTEAKERGTVLELAILGLLKENELHGYELKKRLSETLGPFSSVSFGSLYPCLARLERAGAVKAVEALPGGRALASIPMTGSLGGEAAAFFARRQVRRSGGRSRKVYGITEHGERLFADLLAAESATGDDERSFNLKLSFARYLPREARIKLLERRRGQLVERLARGRSGGRARDDRMDSYTRSLNDHRVECTERDISWLDSLIASERRTQQPEEGH
jgi:DNA-binding PadR family transcriptional regulator